MTDAVRQILDRAMTFSDAERAEISSVLIQSLDGPPPPAAEQAEIDAAWSAEIRRRVAAYEDGTATLVDGDQILGELRSGRRGVDRT